MRRAAKFRAEDSVDVGDGAPSPVGEGGRERRHGRGGRTAVLAATASEAGAGTGPERSFSVRWTCRRARLKRHVSDLSW